MAQRPPAAGRGMGPSPAVFTGGHSPPMLTAAGPVSGGQHLSDGRFGSRAPLVWHSFLRLPAARVFLLPPAHSCFPIHLPQALPPSRSRLPAPSHLLSLRHVPHRILAFASRGTWTNIVNCPITFPFYKRYLALCIFMHI